MAPRHLCAASQVPIFGTFSRAGRGRAQTRVKNARSGLGRLAAARTRG